ncbi:MAG: MaoC family dehydratase N-terminal domain-containing protein, partial [Dehalococcoidia bacterium]
SEPGSFPRSMTCILIATNVMRSRVCPKNPHRERRYEWQSFQISLLRAGSTVSNQIDTGPGFFPYPPAGNRGSGPGGPQPSRPLKRILNGGTEIEYHGDICAGDVLQSQSYIADLQERKGSIGEMLITTSKTEYHNQNGDLVAVATNTAIRY